MSWVRIPLVTLPPSESPVKPIGLLGTLFGIKLYPFLVLKLGQRIFPVGVAIIKNNLEKLNFCCIFVGENL